MNVRLTDEQANKIALAVPDGFDEEKGYIRAGPTDYVRAGWDALLAHLASQSDEELMEEMGKVDVDHSHGYGPDGGCHLSPNEIRKFLSLIQPVMEARVEAARKEAC